MLKVSSGNTIVTPLIVKLVSLLTLAPALHDKTIFNPSVAPIFPAVLSVTALFMSVILPKDVLPSMLVSVYNKDSPAPVVLAKAPNVVAPVVLNIIPNFRT